jgi:hypothetical protein
MVKFVKEKGEISRFSCLSRYSRNLSRPGNMFMLVPLVHDVLVDNFRHSFLPDRRAQDFEKILSIARSFIIDDDDRFCNVV